MRFLPKSYTKFEMFTNYSFLKELNLQPSAVANTLYHIFFKKGSYKMVTNSYKIVTNSDTVSVLEFCNIKRRF